MTHVFHLMTHSRNTMAYASPRSSAHGLHLRGSFRRPFGATMILPGRIMEQLGSHQHLAVDVDLCVDDLCLVLTSDAQRF